MAVYYLQIDNCSCCNQNCAYTLPTLFIDGTTTPYATQSDANAALTNEVYGCLFQTDFLGGTSASANSTALVIAATMTGPELLAAWRYGFAANVTTAGMDLAFSWAGASGSYVNFTSYDLSWNMLDTAISSAASGVLHLNSSANTCSILTVKFLAGSGPPDPKVLNLTVTSNSTWDIAVVQAAYSNGGGTAYQPC